MNLPVDALPNHPKQAKGQFGIGRLMVLTAAVAVIMSVAVRLNAPRIAQGLLVGYLFFFALWAVMRGPRVYADFVDLNRRRRQIKQRRSDLERELCLRKRHRETDSKK